MNVVTQSVSDITEILDKYTDPRASNFPLLKSVWPTVFLLAAYIIFCQNIGPKWMKNRKPFQLKTIVLVYDAVQVALNFLLGSVGLGAFFYFYYSSSLRCAMPHLKDDERGWLELRLTYAYFLLKVLDLADTVFFVLMKNFRLITFLHVYHHALMVFITHMYARYYAGGQLLMIGLINLWIHVIMYSYYFVAALKPEIRNSLWWKRYITLAQMGQFVFLIYFLSLPLFEDNCKYPKNLLYFAISQNVIMLILFANFYIRAYVISKPKQS